MSLRKKNSKTQGVLRAAFSVLDLRWSRWPQSRAFPRNRSTIVRDKPKRNPPRRVWFTGCQLATLSWTPPPRVSPGCRCLHDGSSLHPPGGEWPEAVLGKWGGGGRERNFKCRARIVRWRCHAQKPDPETFEKTHRHGTGSLPLAHPVSVPALVGPTVGNWDRRGPKKIDDWLFF